MTSRFSFYDFLGFIIPGAILLLAVIYWAESVLEFDLVTVGSISNVGQTTLFIFVAYLVGHLMQGYGRELEKKEAKRWGGYFSVQFLRPSDASYSDGFKGKLQDAISETFDLAPLADSAADEAKDKRIQEMFNVCYTFVVQRGIAQHAEIHNATYGFFRGLLVLWLVVMALFSIAAVRHASIAAASVLEWVDTPFDDVKWHLMIAGVTVVIAASTFPFLRDRFKHFGRRFVDAVYRSFYAFVTSGHIDRES